MSGFVHVVNVPDESFGHILFCVLWSRVGDDIDSHCCHAWTFTISCANKSTATNENGMTEVIKSDMMLLDCSWLLGYLLGSLVADLVDGSLASSTIRNSYR